MACVLAALVAVGAAQADSFERGRLFRVERAGIAPSYVFGTLHSNDPRVLDVPDEVRAALGDSRTAAFETLLVDPDIAAFVAAARYERGRRLSDDIGRATLERLAAALADKGLDAAMLDSTKPWAALLLLAQGTSSGPPTLDEALRDEAQARGVKATGLELPEEQVASLDAIPLASQVALVRWALDTRDRRPAELEATTRAWLAGDLTTLRRLALARDGDRGMSRHFAALFRHLITNRNVLMAHRLHLPLAHGRVFVAVGALHLGGRDGLLALIERQGYRVRRVL